MRLFLLLAVFLGSTSMTAFGQDDEATVEFLFEACISGLVDTSKPAADRSRAERRAVRRCERDAERAAAAAAADDDDDEGLICRRESVVGTHQRRRVCTTRAQREAARESTREVLRDVTRNRGAEGPEG